MPLTEDNVEGPPGCILVIDDEAIMRASLGTLLEDWGYEVLLAEDAPTALRQAASCGPDLILADYRLRDGQTGTHAVKQVRHACGRAIPAIILTGDTAPERIAEVQASGFRIAHKPVVPERLKFMMAELRLSAPH